MHSISNIERLYLIIYQLVYRQQQKPTRYTFKLDTQSSTLPKLHPLVFYPSCCSQRACHNNFLSKLPLSCVWPANTKFNTTEILHHIRCWIIIIKLCIIVSAPNIYTRGEQFNLAYIYIYSPTYRYKICVCLTSCEEWFIDVAFEQFEQREQRSNMFNIIFCVLHISMCVIVYPGHRRTGVDLPECNVSFYLRISNVVLNI